MRKYALAVGTVSIAVVLAAGLYSCGGGGSGSASYSFPVDSSIDLADLRVNNRTAYITSQCYTRTQDDAGGVFNPCYSCHSPTEEPNYLDGSDRQLELSFPRPALTNPFANLFEDRSQRVAAISDAQMLDYLRASNYFAEDGTIMLAHLLANELPANWDIDQDGRWDGYIPDCRFNFDGEGFDRDASGGYTGWRAFGYYPFLGTFWPTNGSTDDVLIRLSEPFRRDEAGEFDLDVYKLNFAVVRAMIQRQDVPIEPADENRYQVDLNKNGVFDTADVVAYDWAPNEGRNMSYVGQARLLTDSGELEIAAGLFPLGTEFLHSVRYLDPRPDGSITLAARMKELRYARKDQWYNYSELWGEWHREAREKRENPNATKSVIGDLERGMRTKGWRYQGFIEDKDGNLRPQTQEETFFCMGCHGGLGSTTDTVFSFPRIFGTEAFQRGWYHWSQRGLEGIPEPMRSHGNPEYAFYLENNRAGDEFRSNQEVMERFFDARGS